MQYININVCKILRTSLKCWKWVSDRSDQKYFITEYKFSLAVLMFSGRLLQILCQMCLSFLTRRGVNQEVPAGSEHTDHCPGVLETKQSALTHCIVGPKLPGISGGFKSKYCCLVEPVQSQLFNFRCWNGWTAMAWYFWTKTLLLESLCLKPRLYRKIMNTLKVLLR